MSRVGVILQPSYLPWRGYFDLMRRADVFIWYDDVQFDRSGWRNRNRIKTSRGLEWLTVPVFHKGHLAGHTQIQDIRIDNQHNWRSKHLAKLAEAYGRAPHFAQTHAFIESLLAERYDLLSDLTITTCERIGDRIGIPRAKFLRSSGLRGKGSRTERLIALLLEVGATAYLSGPSARAYLDVPQFERAGIDLSYIDYSYLPYTQLHGAFQPEVSIVDLFMMTGQPAIGLLQADRAGLAEGATRGD